MSATTPGAAKMAPKCVMPRTTRQRLPTTRATTSSLRRPFCRQTMVVSGRRRPTIGLIAAVLPVTLVVRKMTVSGASARI